MARVSKAKKKASKKTRRAKAAAAIVNVVQTMHNVLEKPTKRKRTRSTKYTEALKKKQAAGGGGGGGIGGFGITPFKGETVMKIPATLATNQQAVIENLREGQRRQENQANFLMGAMLMRPQVQGALPPPQGVQIEEIDDDTQEVRAAGVTIARLPNFQRRSFVLEGNNVTLRADSLHRQRVNNNIPLGIINQAAASRATRLFPGRVYIPAN